MNKRILTTFIYTGLFLFLGTPLFAKEDITLKPMELEGDNTYSASLAATISEKLLLTLHLMNEYNIKEIPEEEWNIWTRKKIIRKYDLQSIIFGTITAPKEGDVILTFKVEYPEDDRISREITISASGYIEIFDKIDTLVIEIVEELIQDHFSYGSLTITNKGTAPEYWISLDGVEVGKNIHEIPMIAADEHVLKVYTKTETDVNIVDFYEFKIWREDNINYEFTLDADQEFSKARTHKLKDGRTLNMTRIQWKQIRRTDQRGGINLKTGTGVGLLIPGAIILGACLPLNLIFGHQYNITQNEDFSKAASGTQSGMIVGGILTIVGSLILFSSLDKLDKQLNREFALSAAPIFAPKADGTLTAGISVSFKL